MLFREIAPNEAEHVYQMGYKEWAKGRTYKQYVEENQKEEDYGTRYVYVDQDNNIIGSLIVLFLKIKRFDQHLPFYGLGSFVIDQDFRRMGHGKELLVKCLSHIEQQDKNTIFMLYSDINPHFYYPFGFKELPEHLQRYPKSICMVRCSHNMYHVISKLPITQIPAYF